MPDLVNVLTRQTRQRCDNRGATALLPVRYCPGSPRCLFTGTARSCTTCTGVSDGCEVRLCDRCARVRPCVPCVSRVNVNTTDATPACVSRLPRCLYRLPPVTIVGRRPFLCSITVQCSTGIVPVPVLYLAVLSRRGRAPPGEEPRCRTSRRGRSCGLNGGWTKVQPSSRV